MAALLKFTRLTPTDINTNSNSIENNRPIAISTMACSMRILALGTHWGHVYLMDFEGNIIKTHTGHHQAAITDLRIDSGEEYLISSGDDGRIVLISLYNDDNDDDKAAVVFPYSRPMKGCAFHPEYKQHRYIVFGGAGGELVMKQLIQRSGSNSGSSSRWISRMTSGNAVQYRDSVIYKCTEEEESIHAVDWNQSLIVFATTQGVNLMDSQSRQLIASIPLTGNENLPIEFYKFHFGWRKEFLFIGWASFLIKLRILSNSSIETIFNLEMDYIVAGLACLSKYLAVLSIKNNQSMEIRLFDSENEFVACEKVEDIDTLYKSRDCKLTSSNYEESVYLTSPDRVISCQLRSAEERIVWLLERENFEEALTELELIQPQISDDEYLRLRDLYLQALLAGGRFEEAARQCKRLLNNPNRDPNVDWLKYCQLFASLHQSTSLCLVMPTSQPRLEKQLYETVLASVLKESVEMFSKLLKQWPVDLYRQETVLQLIEDSIDSANQSDNRLLLESAASLLSKHNQYGKSLDYYLRLGQSDVVCTIVEQKSLFNLLNGRLLLLMKGLLSAEGPRFLIEHLQFYPIGRVVEELREEPRQLHRYLAALFDKDSHIAADYHNLQLDLYAEFEPEKLLNFLRQSCHYSLEKALQLAEQRSLMREQVYILGRMGNSRQALNIIVEKLNDVQLAIQFVQESNDDEQWRALIDYSIDKPLFIHALLMNIGAHLDPIDLIRRIPKSLAIPELKSALTKVVHDYRLQVSLFEGCAAIFAKDCCTLLYTLVQHRRRALLIRDNPLCSSCGDCLEEKSDDGDGSIFVFACGHLFHRDCCDGGESCPICFVAL